MGKPYWELNPTERAPAPYSADTKIAHSQAASSQPCLCLILTRDFSWAMSVLSMGHPPCQAGEGSELNQTWWFRRRSGTNR